MQLKLLLLEFFFGTLIVAILSLLFYALYKEVYIPKWQRVYNFINSYYQHQLGGTPAQRKEELHKLLIKSYGYEDIVAWRMLSAYEDGDAFWFKTYVK